MSDVTFIPLGGAEVAGSSCYYLEADGLSFIFDCGSLENKNVRDWPFFAAIPQDKKIEAIFISHIHHDHIAGLKILPPKFNNIPIITSHLNKELFFEVIKYSIPAQNVQDFDRMRILSDSMIALPYMTTQDFGKYKVTLYEAGHTPGACMVAIETENHRILYTGDKSSEYSAICNPYYIPEGKKFDIVINCANGYFRDDAGEDNDYIGLMEGAFLTESGLLSFSVNQPIKVIELLPLIAKKRDINRPDAKIYVPGRLFDLAQIFTSNGIAVIPPNCHFGIPERPDFSSNAIYLHLKNQPEKWLIDCIPLNYYLHDTDELGFIDKYAEKDVFMVHLFGNKNYIDKTEEYNGKTLHFCSKGTAVNV